MKKIRMRMLPTSAAEIYALSRKYVQPALPKLYELHLILNSSYDVQNIRNKLGVLIKAK